MNWKNFFHSKKIFAFNLVMTGLIIGFVLTLTVFTKKGEIIPSEGVSAQESALSSMETGTLEGLQTSFRIIAENVRPSVVEIDIIGESTTVNSTIPFEWFFGVPQDGESPETSPSQEYTPTGLGSGIIVKRQGEDVFILTNNHVVNEAAEVSVKLIDGRTFSAEIVGSDERKDLAMIKFTTSDEDIVVAQLGDSDDMYVGDWVLAIGNPLGYESTVSHGIVSAIGRQVSSIGNISDFIQTDAAINQGNSGGALVNIRGEIIGINTWISSNSGGGNIGLGFAIPINNAKDAIDDFIDLGQIEYGWLGVSVIDIPLQMVDEMELNNKKGAFVMNVFNDSPAEKSGILPGDLIIGIDGERAESRDEVVYQVSDLMPGQTYQFEVIRYGETKVVDVTILKRESEDAIGSKQIALWPGFIVTPIASLDEESLKELDGAKGVVVSSVVENTPGAIAGLRIGDLITDIGNEKVETIMEFYQALNNGRGEKRFSFIRNGVQLSIGITP